MGRKGACSQQAAQKGSQLRGFSKEKRLYTLWLLTLRPEPDCKPICILFQMDNYTTGSALCTSQTPYIVCVGYFLARPK